MANWKTPRHLPDGVGFVMVGPSVSFQTVLRVLGIWLRGSWFAVLVALGILVATTWLVQDFNLILPFLPFLGMAWSDPTSRSTGNIITSAIWNQDVVDNPQYLKDTLDALELSDLQAASGNYDMGGNKITNYGTPSAAGDVADKGYVDAMGARAYDSGWFAVALNTTYTKAHGLGSTPSVVVLWFSTIAAPGAGDEIYRVTVVADSANNLNMDVVGANGTNVLIHTGDNALDGLIHSTRITNAGSSGYYRILAWA